MKFELHRNRIEYTGALETERSNRQSTLTTMNDYSLSAENIAVRLIYFHRTLISSLAELCENHEGNHYHRRSFVNQSKQK